MKALDQSRRRPGPRAHPPAADEQQAHEPRVRPGFIGDGGHDLLLAGGARRHAGVPPQRRVVADVLLSPIRGLKA